MVRHVPFHLWMIQHIMVGPRMNLATLNRPAAGERSTHQVKVVTAERTTVGLKEPADGSFKPVPRPYASEIDGFAIGAN
jgi:hypothetical protein